MPPIVNDRVAWSVGLSVGSLPIVGSEKTSEAIGLGWAQKPLKTRVGPKNPIRYSRAFLLLDHIAVIRSRC